MKTHVLSFLAVALLLSPCARAQSFLEKLGLRAASTNAPSAPPAGLSQDDITGGLKEALSKGVEHAVATLGREDGFLKDAGVKIAMPESLEKVFGAVTH